MIKSLTEQERERIEKLFPGATDDVFDGQAFNLYENGGDFVTNISFEWLLKFAHVLLALDAENETWKSKHKKLLSRIHKLEKGFMEHLESKEGK